MSDISKNQSYFGVMGMRVDLIQIPGVINQTCEWVERKENGHYIVLFNANDVVSGKKDPRVKRAVNASSLSVPDGISLVWLARLRGQQIKQRVYGPDLMLEFLKVAETRGYSNFFYGTTPDTLAALINRLKSNFPKLKVAGSYAPPFRPLDEIEDTRITGAIQDASPDILWVGLGTPKQQLWMYEHKNKLKVPVMLGVGAAFDFLSGVKPQAPRWIRDNGFEWLFRLITEPKRLWRRYLINGSLFIYYVLSELLLSKFHPVDNFSRVD